MTRDEALLATNQNQQAADFLLAYVAYCHLLDDIVDKDKPVDDLRLVRESLSLIDAMLLNPWVRDNAVILWPLITSGFNAWLDANRWETSACVNQQRAADVVKGIYHEIVWVTARICGGFDHMRWVTSEHREYDYDFDRNQGQHKEGAEA